MKLWIWLVLLYAVLKGIRDIVKKKALMKSSVPEVLLFYTLIGFLFVLPDTKTAMQLDFSYLGLIAVKSLIIMVAWILSYHAICHMPVSLFGVMDLSRVVFTTAMSVILFHEVLTRNRLIGMGMVVAGLVLVNLKKEKNGSRLSFKYTAMVLISCLLNGVSELMDKYLMQHMESSQLQYWYMLFMVLMYIVYILITRTKIDWKHIWKNYWIVILSVLFVAGDRALFIANASGESSVILMALIKQSAVLVAILGGYVVFREKDVLYRMGCALVIVAGIVVALL